MSPPGPAAAGRGPSQGDDKEDEFVASTLGDLLRWRMEQVGRLALCSRDAELPALLPPQYCISTASVLHQYICLQAG